MCNCKKDFKLKDFGKSISYSIAKEILPSELGKI